MRLSGLDGARLGVVREAFVDLATGRMAFLIVEAGGLLGGSGKFTPAPWSIVRYDPIAKAFQASLSKDAFKAAPDYDRDQLSKPGFDWSDLAIRYFQKAAPAVG